MSMKQGKMRYIYKRAFDHLPFTVPHGSSLTDDKPTTVVNIALFAISACNTDSFLCGYVNQ